jgi:hypothetical protein
MFSAFRLEVFDAKWVRGSQFYLTICEPYMCHTPSISTTDLVVAFQVQT